MHYANGREAKVGDPVVGRTYNQPEVIAGTLVSVTPGPDSCSAQVAYFQTHPFDGFANGDQLCWFRGSEQHGLKAPLVITTPRLDYTECKNLVHADDARKALVVEKAGTGG
jgi:hypothetical protein